MGLSVASENGENPQSSREPLHIPAYPDMHSIYSFTLANHTKGNTSQLQAMRHTPLAMLQPPEPIFLLGVSSDYAQPITGQVTEVHCPVIS